MKEERKGLTVKEMLQDDAFHYGVELVSSRGIAPPGEDSKLIGEAEALAQDPHFSWVSVTDNPGGNPMLPADYLARRIREFGSEAVIHASCKDLNRNGLESTAWRCAAEGFQNILALTGDYPVTGFGGNAVPVFDLDSVGLIAMLKAMNDGLEVPGRKGKTDTLTHTDFFIGCAVSPFKQHEREYLPQLFKLARKVHCGAHWVIPQLGYDMRKLQELKLFMNWAKIGDVPLVGNVYLLSKFVARLFNGNHIPGCVVSDDLLALVNKYATGPDKGKAFFRELAAQQLAVFKGLGYQAGYLAGAAKPEVFGEIIDMAESYGEDDWKTFAKEIQFPLADEFYLYEQDTGTGLSDPESMNKAYLESLVHPTATKNVSPSYRLSRKVHAAAFARGKGQYEHIESFYGKLEGKKGHGSELARKALHGLEKVSKQMMYGCKDCGDCSLPDCAYLCPRTACSKTGRNGPCGGSRDGRCELDDKECIWARAYDRTKYYGESQQLLDGPPVIYNPELEGTSAWANTFLDKDHHAPHGEEAPLIPEPLPTNKKKETP